MKIAALLTRLTGQAVGHQLIYSDEILWRTHAHPNIKHQIVDGEKNVGAWAQHL